MERFASFGPSHLAALALVFAVAAATALAARRDQRRRRVLSHLIGASVLGAGLGFVLVEAVLGTSWRFIAPLHLCDIAVFVAAAALFSQRQLPFELLYYWGMTGTLLALITPELAEDFPHHRFIFYFAQHGLLVVGAVFLSVGLGMRPSKGSVLRAWLWLNLVAIVVGLIDYLFEVNFLYLRAKPDSATPLDWFGPWPWYLIAAELLALLLFLLLSLPFRRIRLSPVGPKLPEQPPDIERSAGRHDG